MKLVLLALLVSPVALASETYVTCDEKVCTMKVEDVKRLADHIRALEMESIRQSRTIQALTVDNDRIQNCN